MTWAEGPRELLGPELGRSPPDCCDCGWEGSAVMVAPPPGWVARPLFLVRPRRPACRARTSSSAHTVYSSPVSSRCDPQRSASRATISSPRPACAETDIEYGFFTGRGDPPPSGTSMRRTPHPEKPQD